MLDSGMGDCLLNSVVHLTKPDSTVLKRLTRRKNGLVKTLYPQQAPFAKLKNPMAENQKTASPCIELQTS